MNPCKKEVAMLVLSRKVGEKIVIGNGNGIVVLTVLGINWDGNAIKLGFEADKTIPIHRKEVVDRMQADRDEANV